KFTRPASGHEALPDHQRLPRVCAAAAAPASAAERGGRGHRAAPAARPRAGKYGAGFLHHFGQTHAQRARALRAASVRLQRGRALVYRARPDAAGFHHPAVRLLGLLAAGSAVFVGPRGGHHPGPHSSHQPGVPGHPRPVQQADYHFAARKPAALRRPLL
nr:hypothetical protein [Tanacetum cinerariifolium]